MFQFLQFQDYDINEQEQCEVFTGHQFFTINSLQEDYNEELRSCNTCFLLCGDIQVENKHVRKVNPATYSNHK